MIESINAETYAATLTGYTYELNANERGFYVEVHGFAHKLPALLTRICAALRAVATTIPDAPTLDRVRTEYDKALEPSLTSPLLSACR